MKRLLLVLLLGALAVPAFAQTAPVATPQVPDAEQFVGPPKGTPLAGAELEKRSHEVSALLRCPVCQGLSVADSKAEMAINMKGQVHDLLARGYTEEQILSYFEKSYGQFVLLKPKFQGVNTLVWLLPLLALIAGAAIVFSKVRKLEQPAVAAVPTNDQRPTTNAAEDPYLAQVRALVEGKK
jgi:cytochrome c-type biogenesis protein CcmH